MAGITQTIPNYTGGISEQPDQLKVPGQVKSVQNAIPDIVYGLYKRPGAKRIGSTKLTNVQTGGSWFHYYRDETEGSYIGQVASDGKVRIWSCNDGIEKNVWYDTDNSSYNSGTAAHTAITSYLTPNPSSDTEDIQALTINDTTFLNNRAKVVATSGTTETRPHKNFAYVELARTENGRQYGLNIHDDSTTQTQKTATRIKIKSDTLDEGNGSGTCAGIGTMVFAISKPVLTTTITNAGGGVGSGYNGVQEMPVTVTGGGGSGAKFQLVEVGGVITAVTIIHCVTGYTSAPTLTIGQDWTSGEALNGSAFQRHNAGKLYTSANGINTTCGSTAPTHTSGTVSDGNIDWTYAGTRATATCTVGTAENLIFRVSALGQQGVRDGAGSSVTGNDYRCSYNRELTLLHGGEGWDTDDEVTVEMTQAATAYTYTIQVTDHESPAITANIKAIRPVPTPFDGDTSVTVEAILGGIADEISGTTVNGNPILTKIVGNGIYLYTAADADDFNVEVVDQDLMRVVQQQINDVQTLPLQCVHGMIVKISNTRMSDEDDYYVKFNGENGKDGAGSWIECAAPGIIKGFDADTMPHILQRQADGDFLVKKYSWKDREIGDDVTNPQPSFIGKTINKVLFFRNRLAFLSGESVITSRPGSVAEPNFWSNTALTVSASDPIDISSSSMFPSALYDGIEINAGLLVFSSNQQFLLASDDTILNPDTAKLRAVAWYNYDKVTPPISLGQTVGFIDNSNKYSRFMEIANIAREGVPMVQDTSKVVPSLLPKDLDLFTNSKENNLVFFGKTDSDTVIGYRYIRTGDKQIQTSWFKWKFNTKIKYHFCVNDQYFFLDKDNFLQQVNLVQEDADPSITQDGTNYKIHLDNYTTVANGVFNATTNKTTFTNQSDWIDEVTSTDNKLVLVDIDTNTARVGRYAECTVINSDDFTVPGDWSSATLNIGYLYDYQVDFPRFYLQRTGEEGTVQSDINSKLTVHRMKLNFGKIGLYETTLTRVGKDPYTEIYESTDLDEYDASDAPYLTEKIKDVPIYERNLNVDVTLKSTHPAPATLRSMSWEGDWSPMHYRRI